jgi:hypothetical protein
MCQKSLVHLQGVAGSNPVSPAEARGSESLRFRASRRMPVRCDGAAAPGCIHNWSHMARGRRSLRVGDAHPQLVRQPGRGRGRRPASDIEVVLSRPGPERRTDPQRMTPGAHEHSMCFSRGCAPPAKGFARPRHPVSSPSRIEGDRDESAPVRLTVAAAVGFDCCAPSVTVVPQARGCRPASLCRACNGLSPSTALRLSWERRRAFRSGRQEAKAWAWPQTVQKAGLAVLNRAFPAEMRRAAG